MKNKYAHVSLLVAFLMIESCQSSFLFAQTVKLKWLNFSPYTEVGQNPNQGDSIPDSQINCLLDTLQPWVEGIRTFGTQNGLQNIPILANQKGFNVIVGIWLGKEDSSAGIAANQQQIANGIALANAGYADKLIVGSEVLLRGDLTSSQLVAYINQVQVACPNVPVSCADVCSELIAHPEIIDACDFVAPNIYPFWEGSPIECAMQRFHQCYSEVLSVANGKEIFVSESGWKTEGNQEGSAIPSLENAIRYNRELLNWSQTFGIDVNLFSAFDEPWKAPNDDGWGVFYSNKNMKPGMDTLFAQPTIVDSTWLCEYLNNSSNDTLYVDYIPPIGSFSNLKGHVDHMNPCEYKIATYIKVGGWWTKPTFNNPTVPILCNGDWTVDFTTGGQDHMASDICVFVVPANYSPPLCPQPTGGFCGSIPQEIYQNAIDWKCIHRYELTNVTLTASADTVCIGESITLTASDGEFFLWKKYKWGGYEYLTMENDTTSSIEVTLDYSPYTYEVEIIDGMGGGVILEKTIVVIDIGMSVLNETVCLYDSSATLTANVWGPSWYNYGFTWNTGETTQSIQVIPVAPSASYSVTVSTILGCTESNSGIVYVQESYLDTSDDSICVGQSANLYAWGVSLVWNTGATTSTIYVSPANTSAYSVTVTTNSGCIYEFQDTIVVFSPPDAALFAHPNPMCSGDSALLVASGGILYDWVGNEFDDIPLTSDSILVVPNSFDVYQVKVHNEGCHLNAQVYLEVVESFTLSLSTSNDTIILGETTTLIAGGGDIFSTYLWNTGETTSTIQVSPTSSTEYFVTVTNSDGCSRSGSIIVTVQSMVAASNTNDVESLSIFPNPVSGEFHVKYSTNLTGFIELSILNELGQILIVRNELPVSGIVLSSFNLTEFPAGIYLLKIKTTEGKYLMRKFANQ